jgi:hypothetical protein
MHDLISNPFDEALLDSVHFSISSSNRLQNVVGRCSNLQFNHRIGPRMLLNGRCSILQFNHRIGPRMLLNGRCSMAHRSDAPGIPNPLFWL